MKMITKRQQSTKNESSSSEWEISPNIILASDASDNSDSSSGSSSSLYGNNEPVHRQIESRSFVTSSYKTTVHHGLHYFKDGKRDVIADKGIGCHETKMKSKVRPKDSRSVSFSTVEFRSYAMILGDNPSCDDNGPPLTIDWDPEGSKTLYINKYEDWREQRCGRRHGDQLKIGGFSRHRILKRSGVSSNDILDRMKEMNIIRRRRAKCRNIYSLQHKLMDLMLIKPKKAKDQCTGHEGRDDNLNSPES